MKSFKLRYYCQICLFKDIIINFIKNGLKKHLSSTCQQPGKGPYWKELRNLRFLLKCKLCVQFCERTKWMIPYPAWFHDWHKTVTPRCFLVMSHISSKIYDDHEDCRNFKTHQPFIDLRPKFFHPLDQGRPIPSKPNLASTHWSYVVFLSWSLTIYFIVALCSCVQLAKNIAKYLLFIIFHILVLILQSACVICTIWKRKQTQLHHACEGTKSKPKPSHVTFKLTTRFIVLFNPQTMQWYYQRIASLSHVRVKRKISCQ